MTKLRWDKAAPWEQDPGRVISPPEDFKPDPWVPPAERARRKAKQAQATARLLQRSEHIRYRAIIKKHGPEKAVALGVPRDFVASHLEAKSRSQQLQLLAPEKRERRSKGKSELKPTK